MGRMQTFCQHKLGSVVAFLLAFLLIAGAQSVVADTLYVGNAGSHIIQRFDTAGVGSVFASTPSAPYGMAFDTSGNLYVALTFDDVIEKITPDGHASVFANSGLYNPYGLAFDAAGNLYVANQASSTIAKFTRGGVGSVFASTGVLSPFGLAFDHSGNLYATDPFNTIEKITPSGVVSVFAGVRFEGGHGLNYPIGLACDAAGNVYAANAQDTTIEKITPEGVCTVFANTPGSPYGLAFDSAGNLYASITGATNSIMKFTPDGAGSLFAPIDSYYPTFIAIQPGLIPEPSACSLLLLAFGSLLGFCRLRKSQRTAWSRFGLR